MLMPFAFEFEVRRVAANTPKIVMPSRWTYHSAQPEWIGFSVAPKRGGRVHSFPIWFFIQGQLGEAFHSERLCWPYGPDVLLQLATGDTFEIPRARLNRFLEKVLELYMPIPDDLSGEDTKL
jgi:hypothetical protein